MERIAPLASNERSAPQRSGFRAEANCLRLNHRLVSPVTVELRGRVFPARDWSPAGIFLVDRDRDLEPLDAESAEIRLPCVDGELRIAATLELVRSVADGFGFRIKTNPRREARILARYAEEIETGVPPSLDDLEDAAKSEEPSATNPTDPSSPIPSPGTPPPRWSTKHWLLAGAFALVIVALASAVLPSFLTRFVSRLSEPEHYKLVAASRVRSAELAVHDIDGKIRTAKSLLGEDGNPSAKVRLTSEQEQLLRLGVDQLESERERLLVHLKILRSNADSVGRGDFFYEQSTLAAYGVESGSDPAPYLTDVLADVAASARLRPQAPEDIEKFLLVARGRVEQAEHEFRSFTIQRTALEKILERSVAGERVGSMPFNALELMRRDIALLEVSEAQSKATLRLLRENLAAVSRGDLTFEINLLDRFDPRPSSQPIPVSAGSLHR